MLCSVVGVRASCLNQWKASRNARRHVACTHDLGKRCGYSWLSGAAGHACILSMNSPRGFRYVVSTLCNMCIADGCFRADFGRLQLDCNPCHCTRLQPLSLQHTRCAGGSSRTAVCRSWTALPSVTDFLRKPGPAGEVGIQRTVTGSDVCVSCSPLNTHFTGWPWLLQQVLPRTPAALAAHASTSSDGSGRAGGECLMCNLRTRDVL
jgi:hypothetical protein